MYSEDDLLFKFRKISDLLRLQGLCSIEFVKGQSLRRN